MITISIFRIEIKNEALSFVQGVNTEYGKSVPEADVKHVKAMFRSMGFRIKRPRKRADYFSFQIVDTLSREL